MGNRIAAAIAFRKKATDIGGASARRIRIDEKATEVTPSANRPARRGVSDPVVRSTAARSRATGDPVPC
jgi:hypothetical protein